MKRTKKWLLSALVVAFSATTAVAVTSCNKGTGDSSGGKTEHTHTYVDTVTDPTCTEEGYTTHKCECGDSYVDTKVAALGHDYETSVVKYPSATEAGERKVTCTRCDESKSEAIDALTVSMPKVADVLVGVIGSVNATVAFDENSTITTMNYYEEGSSKTTIEFDLAEAMLNTQEGALAGHVKVKINAENIQYDLEEVESSRETVAGEFYIYVNGDEVSFELLDFDGTTKEENFNLSEIVYTAIANEMGLTYDQFATLAYVGGELVNYAPALVNLIQTERPKLEESYITSLQSLFQLVGQDIIKETKDGTNTVYTVDLSALGHFVKEVKDETVASYVDKVFGAGSMTAISNFVVGLPEKTVREVANSVITLGETYGIDVYHIYYLINLTANNMGAENFDIQKAIESQYDKTLGELIIAASGDEAMTVAQMKEMISGTVTMISTLDLDSLYVMISGDTESGSFTEMLEAMIANLPEVASASLVFGENSAFVSANAFVGPYSVLISAVDGVFELNGVINGADVALTVNQNGISFSATQEEIVLANIEFLKTANGYEADVTVGGNDFVDFMFENENDLITAELVIRALEKEYDEEMPDVTLPEGEISGGYVEDFEKEPAPASEVVAELKKVVEIDLSGTLVEGKVTLANVVIQGWDGEMVAEYDEYGNWVSEEYVETWCQVATITYMNNGGVINAEMNVLDEARVDLSNELTDTQNIFTMKVYDLQAGVSNDQTEQVGEATFGYYVMGSQLIFVAEVANINEGVEETLLEASLIVNENEIIAFNWAMNPDNRGSTGSGNHYWVGDVEYMDCVENVPNEWVEISYEATAEGGKWSQLTTYTEKEISYTMYWDDSLEEWVEVAGSRTETMKEETTYGYNAEYAVTGSGATVSFEVVNNDVVENAIEITVSETGISLDADSFDTHMECAINKIENGFEMVIDGTEGDEVAVDMTITVTLENNVLHFGYDYGKVLVNGNDWISGKGGISVSIS